MAKQVLQDLTVAYPITLCSSLPSPSPMSYSGHTFFKYLCSLQLFWGHFLILKMFSQAFPPWLSPHLVFSRLPHRAKPKGPSEQCKVTQPVSSGLQTPYKGCVNPEYPTSYLSSLEHPSSIRCLVIPDVQTLSQSSYLRPKSCFSIFLTGD